MNHPERVMTNEEDTYGRKARRRKSINISERNEVMTQIQDDVAAGEITLAQAIKRLRVDAIDWTQPAFAKVCKISCRSLASIEAGTANPTLGTLEAIFKLFGMYLTLGREDAGKLDPVKRKFTIFLPDSREQNTSDK